MEKELIKADIMRALNEHKLKTYDRLEEKGKKPFNSSHESLGIITEEYHELTHAVESNDIVKIRKEIIDIGVACILSLASIDMNYT